MESGRSHLGLDVSAFLFHSDSGLGYAEQSADTFLRLQLSASSRPLTAVREVPASALPLPGPPWAVQLQIMFLD